MKSKLPKFMQLLIFNRLRHQNTKDKRHKKSKLKKKKGHVLIALEFNDF